MVSRLCSRDLFNRTKLGWVKREPRPIPKTFIFGRFGAAFFWSFFGHFFGHFWDAFPNYTPFSNMQIMVLLWFLGSQLWTYFWATFGPFSDAKSPLKTGYYGYRKWASKNGRDWAEKTTLNGSKKNVTFQRLSPGKKKLSPGKSWKTGMGRGSRSPQSKIDR